jgi:TfoX/Sxy family transcriptional regulator of competence genes
MAYNPENERRIARLIETLPAGLQNLIIKKKMFGGLAFLYSGKMTIGLVGDDLMVRVVSEKMDAVLAMDHVRPMDFTRRPMKEFVFVANHGFTTEGQLQFWMELGLEHARNKLGYPLIK